MPLAPRPLSILSALKFRVGKQNVTTASTTGPHQQTQTQQQQQQQQEHQPQQHQIVHISAPLNLAADIMPPSYIPGPGRNMHAFAKANGPDINGAAVPRGPPETKRADTPQVVSRQAVVEAAKIPVGKHQRFGSVSHQGTKAPLVLPQSLPNPPLASPPMRRARTYSDDRVGGGIWSPAILSDSEFHTPRSEGELHRSARHQAAQAAQAAQEHVHPRGQQQTWETRRGSSGVIGSPFIIGENGVMTTLVGAPVPGNADHFTKTINNAAHGAAHLADHARQSQAKEQAEPPQRTKLPLRDANLRRSYAERGANYADEDELLGAAPPYDPIHRLKVKPTAMSDPESPDNRATMFHDVDIDMRGEDHATPRAAEKKVPKRLLEPLTLPPLPSYRPSEVEASKKRNRQSCDYDDNALSSMTYGDLRAQPFDFDPATQTGTSTSTADDMTGKLEHYKTKPEADQRAFFAQMTLADWETSGDWILGQFNLLTQKLKETRRARRAIVEKFENEIGARDEEVRVRDDAITRKLGKMKENGMRVVGDDE